MPRPFTTKFKDEHHIFVKNVPAALGISAVPRLFEQYEPTRIKNVYPTSNITTIVVTFGTYEEAEQAQEDIDGTRIDNVVLRVEMYDKRRSLRYLKDTGTRNTPRRSTHRPHFAQVEEEYEDEYEGDGEYEEPVYVRPAATQPQVSPGTTTWANIVGNNRGNGMAPLPAPANAVQPRDPTPMFAPANDHNAEYANDIHEPVGPHNNDNATQSEHGSIEVLPPSWETASLADSTTSPTDSELIRITQEIVPILEAEAKAQAQAKTKEVPRTSIVVPWESFDSTERLVQRHCRDCVFCQKRLAMRQ